MRNNGFELIIELKVSYIFYQSFVISIDAIRLVCVTYVKYNNMYTTFRGIDLAIINDKLHCNKYKMITHF